MYLIRAKTAFLASRVRLGKWEIDGSNPLETSLKTLTNSQGFFV
jgi:hypothetical protein